ncbi:RAD51D [Bugula neritina]|uniref:RAD51D n=1 Tax=Bugula neritina TaxID=10212 RepID=A0A7J7K1F2_BUGNE|nr:RAD51D [Bugula neritina]
MVKVAEVAYEVLGEVVAKSFNNEGFLSAEDFLKNFEQVKEANKHTIGEQNVMLLRCAIISKHKCLLRSGQYLSKKALEQTLVLRTGSSKLDKLLDGGFRTGEVVEVYGRSGQGKTQLMIHTTILACFRQRLCPIFDVFALQELLYTFIEAKKSKSHEVYTKVKLIVLDNISALLSPILEYKSSEGYAVVNSVSTLLRRLSVELNIAVLVINGTVTDVGPRGLPKSALGVYWQQTADKQLLLMGYQETPTLSYNCQITASAHAPIT